jgi:hypothetical protein
MMQSWQNVRQGAVCATATRNGGRGDGREL